MKEEHYKIIDALQSEPMLTAYGIGKIANLSPSQVSNFIKPLLDSGVIKVVDDETLNNGKTLYYVSTAAQHEVLDVFAEDIAQLVDMIVETDGELDLVDGVGAVIELALSKIEISKT